MKFIISQFFISDTCRILFELLLLKAFLNLGFMIPKMHKSIAPRAVKISKYLKENWNQYSPLTKFLPTLLSSLVKKSKISYLFNCSTNAISNIDVHLPSFFVLKHFLKSVSPSRFMKIFSLRCMIAIFRLFGMIPLVISGGTLKVLLFSFVE